MATYRLKIEPKTLMSNHINRSPRFVSVRVPLGLDTTTKIKVFHDDEEVLEIDLGVIYAPARSSQKSTDGAKKLARIGQVSH